MSRTKLVFIYNAHSGRIHAALDTLHKWLSPDTYSCQLCRIGYHGFGMRQALRDYLQRLDLELVFLHRDDYRQYIQQELPLPAILLTQENDTTVLLSAAQLGQCDNLEQLLEALNQSLQPYGYSQNL